MGVTPASWKPAAANEEQLSFVLYDSQLSTTTPATVLNMFKQTEAANGLTLTNMPLANILPNDQRFLVKRIALVFNELLAAQDVMKLLRKAVFEFKIQQSRKLVGPLRLLGPITSLEVPGVTDAIWDYMGPAYELETYLVIPGQTTFTFDITTGATAASATTNMTVMLIGELVRGKS